MSTPFFSFFLFFALICTINLSSGAPDVGTNTVNNTATSTDNKVTGSPEAELSTAAPNKTSTSSSSLQVGFYKESCPSVETIVREVVNKEVSADPTIGAALVRMSFHDCFVRGCDASVLLDSKPGNASEKEALTNLSLRGYEIIDEIKKEVEAKCPQVVSCADIINFTARDSTMLLGNITYEVEAGRRDGSVSIKSEADLNLPAPFYDLQQLEDNFAQKGLTLEEMVVLSGSHSIGVAHCASFYKRLYFFNTTNNNREMQDPSLDPEFAKELKEKYCTKSKEGVISKNVTAPFDFSTPNKLDNMYYRNLQENKVLMTSDQALMDSPATVSMVKSLGGLSGDWSNKFAKAMVRMGAIEVLTGNQGEIRKNCRVVN